MPFPQQCTKALRDAKRANPSLSWEQVEGIIAAEWEKSQDDLVLTSKPRVTKKQMQGELFDALTTVCGQNPKELTRPAQRVVAVALADIKAVTPEVTPAEIIRRAEAYKRKHRDWPLTPSSLAKYWGEFGGGMTAAGKRDPYVEPANWRDMAARAFPGIEFGDRDWLDISSSVRTDILRRGAA